MKDWVEWHQAYDQPGSSLLRRLEVVQQFLRTAVDSLGRAGTILSLCSGDGRDVIGVLSERPARAGRAVLVEVDESLAARASRGADVAGLEQVEVRCLDAGSLQSFVDLLPVDVLLLCGVFGNIDPETVRTVVTVIPALVRPGGYAIWTRGGSHPDRRPEVREWFRDAGLDEIAFEGWPEPYGVGLNRVAPFTSEVELPSRLFTFV